MRSVAACVACSAAYESSAAGSAGHRPFQGHATSQALEDVSILTRTADAYSLIEMRIKAFSYFLEESELRPHELKNTTLVVDGQNFFYGMYEDSGLPYYYGCEADRFAKYVEKQLKVFDEANINCYFVFKGGHEDIKKKYTRIDEKFEQNSNNYVPPIFMKTVYKQVLEEQKRSYVVCEFEAKKECVALAQKLQCAILSRDVEFCFSGVPYIPHTTLQFNEKQKLFTCKIFNLDNFLQKYSLTDSELAIFIVLSDQHIFPENHFLQFLKLSKIPLNNLKRIISLLRWLGKNKADQALSQIFKHVNYTDQLKFKEEESKIRKFIKRREIPGIPGNYLLDGNKLLVDHIDPFWFVKGIALGHIAIIYINLYRNKVILGSWAIEDKNAPDALLLSIDIIKYAYDLLTNFENDGFTLISTKQPDEAKSEMQITHKTGVKKPEYEAQVSVFENGWKDLARLQLFEHFLKESLNDVDLAHLENVAPESRLLIIALVYFSHKKAADTTCEVYSVLLSYTMLSVVPQKFNECLDAQTFPSRPHLNPTTDKEAVSVLDCNIADALMKQYFQTDPRSVESFISKPSLHSLVEFQHCLDQLNMLNQLCGSSYQPTVYRKTFNASFVYSIMRQMKVDFDGNAMDYITTKLSPAATVLAFLIGLIDVYDSIMY